MTGPFGGSVDGVVGGAVDGGVDVCVVGGGPAGATVAAALARLGRRVAVVEHRTFPRDHVGESLGPGIWPLLAGIGVDRASVEKVGVRVHSAQVRWSTDGVVHRADAGLTVDRGAFDALLLRQARTSGAAVLTGRAGGPAPTSAGWRVPLGARAVDARVLVDASGRRGVLGGRRLRTSARTTALHARWRTGHRGGAPQTLIGALPDGWLWAAKLPRGAVRVMIFVDQGTLREEKSGAGELFRRLLAGAGPAVAPFGSPPASAGVIVCEAGSYRYPVVAARDAIRTGEAAFAIDPLSSCGVTVAMSSAMAAVATVNTLLCADGDADAAVEYYTDLISVTESGHRATATRLYGEHRQYADRSFWRRRREAEPGSEPMDAPEVEPVGPVERRVGSRGKPGVAGLLERRVQLRPPAELRPVACLVGHLVERRPALWAPQLRRPVGFLGGVPLAGLVQELTSAPTLGAACCGWDRSLAPGRGVQIASWFVDRDLLEIAAP